ncbi:MAG: ROK family protein [Melioribacteraceae bacterium]|nr:ROK family protein [Melioribacteraceae bacterium]
MLEVVLGIDIGGTNTVFGLVDRNGNILTSDSIPTTGDDSAESFFERVFKSFNEKFELVKDKYELKGIGIGAPNANYYKGTIEHAPNLAWGFVNVLDIIKQYTDLPAVLTNDANAAALGEMKFGAAKNMKHFIQITLGTGLGSGIVVNGDLVYGHDGFAGEMGHVRIDKNNRVCGCGRKGCLETVASATGIKRTVYELLAKMNDKSSLRDIPFNKLTSKNIHEAAVKGDVVALEAFEYTGKVLGKAISDATAYFSPEAVILFGGLANAGDMIFEPVKRHMEKNMMDLFKNKVQVLMSGLPSGDAAILGASALIWHELNGEK